MHFPARLLGIGLAVALLSVGTYSLVSRTQQGYCDTAGGCVGPGILTPRTVVAQPPQSETSYALPNSVGLDSIFETENGVGGALPGGLTPKTFLLSAGSFTKTVENNYDALKKENPDPRGLLADGRGVLDQPLLAIADDFLADGGRVQLIADAASYNGDIGYLSAEETGETPRIVIHFEEGREREDVLSARFELARALTLYAFDRAKAAILKQNEPLLGAVFEALEHRLALLAMMEDTELGIEDLETTADASGFDSALLGRVDAVSGSFESERRFLAMRAAADERMKSYSEEGEPLTPEQEQYQEIARFLHGVDAAALSQGVRLNAFLLTELFRSIKEETADRLFKQSKFLEDFAQYRYRIFAEFFKRFTKKLEADPHVPVFPIAFVTMSDLLKEGCWLPRRLEAQNPGGESEGQSKYVERKDLQVYTDFKKALNEPWRACRLTLSVPAGESARTAFLDELASDLGELLQLQTLRLEGMESKDVPNGAEFLPRLLRVFVGDESVAGPSTCADRRPTEDVDLADVEQLIASDNLPL